MSIFLGQFPQDHGMERGGPGYQGFRIPPIPEDGWVSHIHVAYHSDSAMNARWGIHGPQGEFIFESPQFSLPATGGNIGYFLFRTYKLPTPIRVTSGLQIYPGILHNENIRFIGDSNNMAPGSGNNWYELIGWPMSQGVPSDIIPQGIGYAPTVQTGVTFQNQLIPSKPVFRSPTPADKATTTTPVPTVSFTLPHVENEDSSKNVEIELTVTSTGASYRWTRPVSSTDNNNGYYSWAPLTFKPGDQVQVRARHQDTWDDWSEYSDYRTFTIFDAAPGQGAFLPPTPTEGQLVGISTPTLKGTTPHPGNDAAYDKTYGVQVQVIDDATDAVLQDHLFGPTAQDMAAKTFQFTLNAIGQNTDCRVRFRHHDIKGTWSIWSAERHFSISAGPDPPTITRPKGKVNFLNEAAYQAGGGTGPLYAGTYNNVSGTAMHSVEVEIWNADASARLYTSGWVARTATGGVWTLPQASFPGHPSSLAWGTTYQIRAKVAETNVGVRGIESGFGQFVELKTNSFPDRPTSLSPSNGIPSATLQFSASALDPDGDAITGATMTIKQVSNNATVYNNQAMDVSGTTLSKTLPGGILTLGQEYQWFCTARDATGFGQASFPEPFVYASVPSPTIVAPRALPADRINLLRDPSAEHESAELEAAPFWSILSSNATNEIVRSEDDSVYGNLSWRATTSASNNLTLQSEAIVIDPTRAYFLQFEAKRFTGTTNLRFRLRVLQANGSTFISNLIPTSIASADGVSVPATWTRYGGIIWPQGSANSPKWPALAGACQVEILPSDDSPSEVFFDGVCFEQLGTTAYTPAQITEAQKWLGYFDGDNLSHRPPQSFDETYYWLGEPGVSTSRGDSRLSSAAGKVYYTFTHNQNMADQRLLIDRLSLAGGSNAWVQIYDSGFAAAGAPLTSGSIKSIDLPPAVIKNDDRFRFRVQIRDALGISGESPPSTSDTDYIGQPEPDIVAIEADPGRAEITLAWAPSTLAANAFGGYEIAREEPDGSYRVLHREMNQSLTTYTDYYPLSDVGYVYMVRVVELVGVDEQQGRWARAPMRVDYFPNSFVKDTELPGTLFVAYETPLDAMPTPQEDAISELLVPWGQSTPMVLTRADMRLRSGTVVANFYKDNLQVEEPMIRYEKMLAITNRRSQICLLMQEPDKERVFCSIMGAVTKTFRGPEQRTVEFAYQENSFQEDLRERGS